MTWSEANGLRLFVNGVDTEIVQNRPARLPREYRGLICRAILGRYAADVRSEWLLDGFYKYGTLSFSDFFYVPAEITPELIPEKIGMTGIIFVAISRKSQMVQKIIIKILSSYIF